MNSGVNNKSNGKETCQNRICWSVHKLGPIYACICRDTQNGKYAKSGMSTPDVAMQQCLKNLSKKKY